jgi:uncharacterized BrkB/YihY/UPF0761 family membrane protein
VGDDATGTQGPPSSGGPSPGAPPAGRSPDTPPPSGVGVPPAEEAPVTGRMARASAAVRHARERADDAKRRGAEIAERERARRPSVAAAFTLSERDRQQAGALLAGGLAFRFFLWLLPLALTAVCIVTAVRDIGDVEPAEAAKTGGLSSAAAAAIADAVKQAGKSWWLLLPVALWLLAWAAAAAARAMWLVSAVSWRVSPGKRLPTLRAAGAFTGIVLGMMLCSLLARPLFSGSALTDVLAWLLTLAAQAAIAFYGLTKLPRPPDITPRDLVPGVLLFVVGLAGLRVIGGWYFAREIGKVADLYGSLGLSVVFLTWLYLFGRFIVAGLMLNGVVARQHAARAEAAASEPAP